MGQVTGYIGTYASPESRGIYQFTMDLGSGALTAPALYYEAANAKYISLENGRMAAPLERDGKAGVCLLDLGRQGDPLIDEVFCEEKPACHLVQDGDWLYTANYHEGHVLAYRTDGGRLELAKRIRIAPKAGCHQVLLDGRYLLVPCLELDCIRIFDREEGFSPVGEIRFPKGSGPRHGVFDGNHGRLYVVSELSNEVYVFRVGPGCRYIQEQAVRLLPEGVSYLHAPASAAIRLSEDGRYLYVSTRFAELLTVFEVRDDGITMAQQVGCGGIHPRDILLAPSGGGYADGDRTVGFLLSVNRTAGGLVSFPVDTRTGKLGEPCSRVPMPEGVSVVLDLKGETNIEKKDGGR